MLLQAFGQKMLQINSADQNRDADITFGSVKGRQYEIQDIEL